VIVERTTVVDCADWPVVALLAGADEPAAPAATFHANRVVAVNQSGHSHGVRVGQRRREAQRLSPELLVLQRDLAAEARLFEVVLSALDDITPRIEIEVPGRCSFATRGPSRYFGGDAAMSGHVRTSIAAVGPRVQVGTADTRFAARIAAENSAAENSAVEGVAVVASGGTAAFLAPLPIELLRLGTDGEFVGTGTAAARSSDIRGTDELIDVLRRLGLRRLGDLAALSGADVLARFGPLGARAHAQASGVEFRLADRREPPPDFESSIELEPPVHRVDQAAFVAKTLAEEFCRRLAGRGSSCSRVAIIAETEHGEQFVRYWRGEVALSVGAIADRTRWQLDGWLSGSSANRPTGGLARLALRPDEVLPATGRQLGFWGGQTQNAERAARAVARTLGLVGVGLVTVPEEAGGRSLLEEVRRVPAEAVDLVEREAAAGAAEVGRASKESMRSAAWSGRVPAPTPAIVYRRGSSGQGSSRSVGAGSTMPRASVIDDDGAEVAVTGRGELSSVPITVSVQGGPSRRVQAWAGPWLVDERWWDQARHRRWARLQVVTDDGRALLLVRENQSWFVEGSYL